MSACIYCNAGGPFSEEHPLPACLGEFLDAPLITDRVCEFCNREIGKAEEQFCRSGPEAFFRQYYGVEGRKSREKVNPFERGSAGAPPIDFLALHLGLGVEILWEFNPGEKTVREVRQVVIIDTNGDSHPVRIHKAMTDPQHLKAAVEKLEIQPKDIYVFADDDEEEWVTGLTQGLSKGLTWRSGQPTEKVRGAAARVQVTSKYFRALAKIGFHYLLAVSTELSGRETEFEDVRRFILHGGDMDAFFREEKGSIIERESEAQRPDRPIHIVLVEWNKHIVQARLQFFLGPDYDPRIYRITLARGVATLGPSGAHGHAYGYFKDGPRGKFAGDVSEIIARPKPMGESA